MELERYTWEENLDSKEAFQYLNELRDSGETNMLGAAPYLSAEFEIDKKIAKLILKDWIRSF